MVNLVESIVILGSSREHAILSAAKDVFDEWLKNWSLSDSAESVSVGLTDTHLPCGWHFRGKDKSSFTLKFGEQNFNWEAAVFASYLNDVPNDSTAAHLVEEGRRDLAKSILRAFAHAPDMEIEERSLVDVSNSEAKMPQKNTHLVLSFSFKNMVLTIQIPFGKWINNFSANAKTIKPLLSKVSVNKSETDFSLELNFGRHELDVLKNLAVGDILTSNSSLESLFSVKMKEKVVARGFLGKSEDNKAVYLQPITKKSV